MPKVTFPCLVFGVMAMSLGSGANLPVYGCVPPSEGGGGGGVPPHAPSFAPSNQPGVVSFRLLERGAISGVAQDTETIFRDSKAWAAFYFQHNANHAVPAVDFTKEMVVAVVLSRNTGGYGVQLGPVTSDGANLVVSYTETQPGPGTLTIQVLTQPYAFAALPATAMPVSFRHLLVSSPAR